MSNTIIKFGPCSVPSCSFVANGPGVIWRIPPFHQFPTIHRAWLVACGGFDFPQEDILVCFKHFRDSDFVKPANNAALKYRRLGQCAIPTKNLELVDDMTLFNDIGKVAERNVKTEPSDDIADQESLNIMVEGDLPTPPTLSLSQSHNTPEPANILPDEKTELLDVLMSFGMGHLFTVFKDENVYLPQLRWIDTAALIALLQPHVRIRVILDFQEKLNKWKVVTPPKKKIDLLDILKTQPVGLNMLSADYLSDNNRKLLVEMIVNHYVRHKIPLTQEARDDMAKQIVNRFPQENPYYYSDNGLQHRGEDKLYLLLRLLVIMNKPLPNVQLSVKSGKNAIITAPAKNPTPPPPVQSPSTSSTSPAESRRVTRTLSTQIQGPPEINQNFIADASESLQLRVTNVESLAAVIDEPPAVITHKTRSSSLGQIKKVTPQISTPTLTPVRTNKPEVVAASRQTLNRSLSPQMSLPNAMLPPALPLFHRGGGDSGNPRAHKLQARRASIAEERPTPRSAPQTVTKVVTRGGDCYYIRKMPEQLSHTFGTGNTVENYEKPLEGLTGETDRNPRIKRPEQQMSKPPVQLSQVKRTIAVVNTDPGVVQEPPVKIAKVPVPVLEEVPVVENNDFLIEVAKDTIQRHVGNGTDKDRIDRDEGADEQMEVEKEESDVTVIADENDDVNGRKEKPGPASRKVRRLKTNGTVQPLKKPNEVVDFIKAERFQGHFDSSLTSCIDLNKNILSLDFERKLGLNNRFRDHAFCEEYVRQFQAVFRQSARFNIDQRHFQNKPLSKRMALALFLLPATLNPNVSFVFRGNMSSNFISVCPSVQEFVSGLPRNASGPYVGIIGKLSAPLSYVVFYKKKVYRCVELWHALDMVIKILIVFKGNLAADCANSWQFIMCHFYEMEKDLEFVYPSVKTLQAFLCLN